ncbi:MAG: ATP-dependent Clp protease ATP-binding subunit [Planctomycetes bacterium]|nr:ATP-dependent Clp protease ATP-binding subunit [Planctomycetota bacterium]
MSFENCLVILTSNAGAPEMTQARKQVGFNRPTTIGKVQLRELAIDALERQFSPEFLGRLDETIVFNELDLKSAQQIAQRQLTELAARARRRGMKVAFTPAVAKWIASKGYSPDYGARELRRVIQREVETPLSRRMIGRAKGEEGLLRVRVESEGLAIELED